jgi:hypothetical protein
MGRMLMKRSRIAGILGLGLVFFVLSGCQQPSLSSDATLKSVSIAGIAATLGTSSSDWTAASEGTITLSNSLSENAVVSISSTKSGATIYCSLTEGTAMPNFEETTTFTFVDGNYLYVEVYSPNLDTIQFYKIKVTVVEDSPVLRDVLLAGRSAAGYSSTNSTVQQFGTGLGTPAATYGAAVAGEVWFGTSQANTELEVSSTPMLTGTAATDTEAAVPAVTVQYAVAPDATTEPVFADSAKVTVTNGSYLYVKATLVSDTTKVLIYKLKLVQKSDTRTLSSVTIKGASDTAATTMDIGVMGTVSFPGEEYYGSYRNGAALATTGNMGVYTTTDKEHGLDSITISAISSDSTVKIEYDVAEKQLDYLVFAHEPATDNTTGIFTSLTSGQYLAIQVTSEIGEKGWYRFRVASGQSGTVLTGATVGTANATIGSALTTFYSYWLQGTTGSVTLSATTDPVTVVAIKDATTSSDAVVEYGIGSSSYGMSTIPSSWNTDGVIAASDISAGKYIVCRVTSGNGLNITYYAMKISIQ